MNRVGMDELARLPLDRPRPYSVPMPRSMAREQDVLTRLAPKRPPRLTSRRIGIHTSTAGGIHNAAERAYRIGCNTLQIFSSSPRQWAPYELSYPLCEQMLRRGRNTISSRLSYTRITW